MVIDIDNKEILKEGLKQLSIDIEEKNLEKLIDFKDMLLEFNEKINLTAITDEKEIYIKHFLDSATCLSTGYIKDDDKIIDVGTGAGFPGLVLKIINNNINITLLDSLRKRIVCLEEIVENLDLKKVNTIHGRAEEYGVKKGQRENYDIVLSRAVASLSVLSEYCIPFAKVGGFFLCQKGPSYVEELKEAEKAINVLGGKVEEIKKFILPYSNITHYIIIIKKVSKTPTKFPRKPGKPSSNPIK